jgi:hypothetical protein
MKGIQARKQIAGVIVMALLIITVAWVPAGCGRSVSDAAITPAGTVSAPTTTSAEGQEFLVRHIPELVPDSGTAVLGIQSSPTPEHSHNLLEE